MEKRLLLALQHGDRSAKELVTQGFNEASISRATNWLLAKGYLNVDEFRRTRIRLASEGERFTKTGLPERLLVNTLAGKKSTLSQAQKSSGLSPDEMTLAIGWARRKGWIQIRKENGETVIVSTETVGKGQDEILLEKLSATPVEMDDVEPRMREALKSLEGRPNVIAFEYETDRMIGLTPAGKEIVNNLGELREEVNQLTPEILVSGRWRDVKFRRYNLQAPVGYVWPGKKQPYLRFLDNVKIRLMAMGFREMKGPAVELMFFNCDALYMPQNHPAREIHDIYYVRDQHELNLPELERYLRNVKETHENGWTTGSTGWGGKFSERESTRLALRSQGTAISARKLVDPRLEIPGKYFSVARVYRPDVVDRTHLTEFNQLEGIILGQDLNFRNLLGTLETFAREVAGAQKISFKPDYFPFTEPSVELSAYREGSGWIELGGAGMFRPEVTEPLGIKVPVIAWGLGVDRMFMMHNNITDIRQLFSQDLNWLRDQRLE